MWQRAELLDELDAVEFRKLVIGENDVDAIVARELECARRRVEELEIQLAVDLADDLGEQEPAGKKVVDDQDGVALRPGEGELGYDSRGSWTKLCSGHLAFPLNCLATETCFLLSKIGAPYFGLLPEPL